MKAVFLIAGVFLLTACDEQLTGPATPLNREFTLAPGETAAIEGSPLAVRFNGVSGDSRCPGDAICIQGGSADVRITAIVDGASRDQVIKTGDMKPVQVDEFTIALVQLAPYPFSSLPPIEPGDYRATLRVTR